MVARDMLNSRVKDYYDIWLLAETFDFEEALLQTAITRTFKRREIEVPQSFPEALTVEFSRNPVRARQWDAFVRNMGGSPLPDSFDAAINGIREFLSPFVGGHPQSDMIWLAEQRCWMAKG